ncbi:MAG: ATPase, partial [Roseovarius sp.]
MNAPTSTVLAPPPPKRLEDMKLPIVMMRDILLKTIFRKNVEMVSDLAQALCLPIPVTQEMV